ncbi:MAG: hypothetical protein RL090_97 [Bacteroidota bacterium]
MSYQDYRPAPFNILPNVVKNLLIINGIFLLADTVLSNQLGLSINEMLGLYFPLSDKFAPYQFITHLFLHGNFLHLFSNMFALWMFGAVLENHWGPKRFLVYYFATGLGAAVIHLLWNWYDWNTNPDSNAMFSYVVGASGAVFGVLLAFGMMFPNTLIYVFFAIPIKAKYFVIIYGLLELYSGLSNNPLDNTAHFAHLGGMLFGFILIKYWKQKDRRYFG